MKLGQRIFLGYVLLLILAGWLFFDQFTKELVPGMRQSLEEALVDSANLLAEQVSQEVARGEIRQGDFAAAMARFHQRRLNAEIWSLKRRLPNLFVYITDAKGQVIYDSRGLALGADYSQWNDVYLTLRGEYGARTSREDPEDPTSSVMYVAAPIYQGDELIGVLTVAKPSMSVQPYIDQMRAQLLQKGLWLVALSLILAALLSFGLSRSVRRLTHYAQAVREGRRIQPPQPREPELRQLAQAMEAMRRELEGKDYVEQYLHTLTHELKSPLAAIRGASELLREAMPEEDRERFLRNIEGETRRMQQVVERLLGLAAVEKRQGLQQVESLDVDRLLGELLESREPRLRDRQLSARRDGETGLTCQGEHFLLQQALGNLLDNAIDFSPAGGEIRIGVERTDEQLRIEILDQGPGIPDYAAERLFERFYSLPRPEGGGKSTGLGLAFVREVAELHGGQIRLENRADGGVAAMLLLPRERGAGAPPDASRRGSGVTSLSSNW